MTVQRYVSITNPTAEFEALAPYDKSLIRLMQSVKPQSPDDLILGAARKALGTAACHFIREPFLYGGRPH
jgi:hypothetical protein